MAKKKKNLQKLIEKRQQLQEVNQVKVVVNIDQTPSIEKVQSTLEKTEEKDLTSIVVPGIGRTIISVVVIIILFSGVVITSHKTSYLTSLGSWLYSAMRLNNS